MSNQKANNKSLKTIILAIIGIIVVSAVALVFVLNKDKEQVVTYEKTEDGITMSLTYYAKGDRVYKQTTKNIVPYSALGVSTEAEARAILDPTMKEVLKEASETAGYEDTIEYTSDKAIETVSLDFNIVDKSKLKDLTGAYFEGDIEKEGWSLSKSIKWLEGNGFTRVNK